MICSTADNDGGHAVVWPARYDECLSIACHDKAINAPKRSSDAEAKYEFHGQALRTNDICYIEDTTHQHTIHGSSVATAIAAGVASLTLACGRYANRNSIISPSMFIKDMFDRMKGGDPESKLVQPATFFPSEVLDLEGGTRFIERQFLEEGEEHH